MTHNVTIPIALAIALAGCQVGADSLVSAGVAPATAQTIASDTAEAGTLFCQAGPTLLAVLNVTVTKADAQAVANGCAQASAIGALTPPTITPVPVAAPPGVQAIVAAIPAVAAAAIQASKPSGS